MTILSLLLRLPILCLRVLYLLFRVSCVSSGRFNLNQVITELLQILTHYFYCIRVYIEHFLCFQIVFSSNSLLTPQKPSSQEWSPGQIIYFAIVDWLLRRLVRMRLNIDLAISLNNLELLLEVRKLTILFLKPLKRVWPEFYRHPNPFWWVSFVVSFIASVSIHIHCSLSLMSRLSLGWLTLRSIRTIILLFFDQIS